MSLRISAPPLPLRLAACLAILAVLGVVGCSKVSPVAPTGTTITLSASPSFISSATGTATITAVVRKPNGTPVANGTEVRFTVDLGTISPIVATTSSGGIATATLTGDGRLGKATVSALVGGGATATTLAVNIGGIPSAAKSITLQANPPDVTVSANNHLTLVAVVRDAAGLPVDGAGVTFSSPVGKLGSGGGLVFTKAGVAQDTLTVTPDDLTNQAGPFNVTANTVASDGSLLPATFAVQVNTGVPVAAFTFSQISGTPHTIQFINQSTPLTGVSYSWQFGDGTTSTEQNPTHTYSTAGPFTVILTVTNASNQSSVASHMITVT